MNLKLRIQTHKHQDEHIFHRLEVYLNNKLIKMKPALPDGCADLTPGIPALRMPG